METQSALCAIDSKKWDFKETISVTSYRKTFTTTSSKWVIVLLVPRKRRYEELRHNWSSLKFIPKLPTRYQDILNSVIHRHTKWFLTITTCWGITNTSQRTAYLFKRLSTGSFQPKLFLILELHDHTQSMHLSDHSSMCK